MKHLFTITVLCFIYCSLTLAQAPDTIWTKVYGDGDYERGNSIVITDDNGFAVVGATNALYSGGNITEGDIWLVRTNSTGDTLWTKTYGGSGIDEGNSIYQTADGGFILAGARSNNLLIYDAWLIRTDSNGDTIWTKTYGDNFAEELASSVIETSDSGFAFTGFSNTQTTFSRDVWLVRTDAAGDTLWTRTFGGTGSDLGAAVLQTADNGFIVTGKTRVIGGEYDLYLIRTDENGNTLWTKTYNGPSSPNSVDDGRDIELISDGGVVVMGFTSLNVWLLRTDANGDTLWTKQYPGSGDSFDKTSDDGFVITGGTWLIRTNASGDLLWSTTFAGLANSVQQTSDGGYIVAGYNFFSATKDDLWLARFGSDPTSIEIDIETPNEYLLFQNYPNPFNPITTISFSIPVASFVSLKVFNSLGQEIEILISKELNEGNYKYDWNAKDLTSGTYFYKLQAGDFIETKKMILIK
jgi:hypothetical protein